MSKLRIGTWNLDCAEGSCGRVLQRAVLLSHRADIWVLTETHDDVSLHPDFQAARSEQQDIQVAPRRLREGSRWVTIWSRYPIREIEVRDRQRTVAALVESPEGLIAVFGVVLPWPGSSPGFVPAVEALADEWKALRSSLPDASLCVAGDFNADMDTGAGFPGEVATTTFLKRIRECGLVCATGPERTPRGWFATPPIDHVLVPTKWAGNAEVIDGWHGTLAGDKLSDHGGLIVQVCI